MIRCKAWVLCTQCLFWNPSKTPRKNVLHTFNRGKNMLINVRLPIAHHVIGHPVQEICIDKVYWQGLLNSNDQNS